MNLCSEIVVLGWRLDIYLQVQTKLTKFILFGILGLHVEEKVKIKLLFNERDHIKKDLLKHNEFSLL